VRESRLPGSAWEVRSNPHPYHDHWSPQEVVTQHSATQKRSSIPKCELENASRKGHLARFHTISGVKPAGVRGFVNFISSAVMDVTIRR